MCFLPRVGQQPSKLSSIFLFMEGGSHAVANCPVRARTASPAPGETPKKRVLSIPLTVGNSPGRWQPPLAQTTEARDRAQRAKSWNTKRPQWENAREACYCLEMRATRLSSSSCKKDSAFGAGPHSCSISHDNFPNCRRRAPTSCTFENVNRQFKALKYVLFEIYHLCRETCFYGDEVRSTTAIS